MSTEAIQARIKVGVTVLAMLESLKGGVVDGNPVGLEIDSRAVPYLKHVIVGFTDGPMASKVEAILSAQEPGHEKWRRFTLLRERPGLWKLSVFPTPFNNPTAPLSPGIPPSASRAGMMA